MEDNVKLKQIDFTKICKASLVHKKAFFITLPIAFVIACFIILSVPRYYTCKVELSPESSTSSLSSLGSLASQFGVNLSGKLEGQQDAISPELYPDLMESKDFLVSMFPIQVKTKGASYRGNYYTYLRSHQKQAWWTVLMNNISSKLKKQTKEAPFNGEENLNPFQLTKTQNDISYLVNNNIKCSVDKKTGAISIVVKDQDPLVCATIADSTRSRLQLFITNYRTKKARIDLEYSENLYKKSLKEYESVRRKYAIACDANSDITLQSVKLELEDIENDMQLKYNNLTATTTQLQAARAKLQERTPAFTTIQSASVPLKPAGPKRMIFVGGVFLFTFVALVLYSVIKEEKL